MKFSESFHPLKSGRDLRPTAAAALVTEAAQGLTREQGITLAALLAQIRAEAGRIAAMLATGVRILGLEGLLEPLRAALRQLTAPDVMQNVAAALRALTAQIVAGLTNFASTLRQLFAAPQFQALLQGFGMIVRAIIDGVATALRTLLGVSPEQISERFMSRPDLRGWKPHLPPLFPPTLPLSRPDLRGWKLLQRFPSFPPPYVPTRLEGMETT